MSTGVAYTFYMSHFLSKFRKDIAGVAWLALSVFLGLALGSFSNSDPSFNSSGVGHVVHNLCGYVGSFLSDLMLQGFGVPAWLFIASVLRMSYLSFTENIVRPSKSSALAALVLVLNTSSLLALHFGQTRIYSGEIAIGGLLGTVMSQALVAVFNNIGAAIILWTATVIFLIYYTQKPLQEVFKHPAASFKKLVQALSKALIAPFAKYAAYSNNKKISEDTKNFMPMAGAPSNKGIQEAESLIRQQEKEAEEETEETVKQSFVLRTLESIQDLKKEDARRKEVMKKVSRRVENWELPKLSMLELPSTNGFKVDQKLISRNTQLLEDKLAQFNIKGQVVAVRPGPAVTMFEYKPNADVKVSRINDFADDISLALSSESVRIIAPLPGRDVVGIETSNPKREMVYLRETLEDTTFWDEKMKLPLALGKQANGETKIVDLRKMPHLMVAGTTGSGKSVFVVSALTGLLFKHSPKTLRLILVDPKQVDLAAFHKVPHLLMPPIRETKKAVSALKWAIREMEKRYRSMSKFGARGIEGFNETVLALSKSDYEKQEELVRSLDETAPHESYYYQPLPYIVIVVEEFGDLMATDKNNVEQSVVRLAQMARACGIHLILAMQSPRKDVVTGLIKTNIPGRISFKVASKMDSRIILDDSGAERLLANGDMLFLSPGIGKPERHHGAWLPEKDITDVTKFWSDQAEPDFDKNAMKMLEGSGGGYDIMGDDEADGGGEDEYDEMYDEILAQVASMKEVSASLLQRRFRLGYPRAARMMEIFEKEGVVGPSNGSKARQVLINKL